MFPFVCVSIPTSRFTKKVKPALKKHIVHLNRGETGTVAINLVELEFKQDGDIVHPIHVVAQTLKSELVMNKTVLLGVIGWLATVHKLAVVEPKK